MPKEKRPWSLPHLEAEQKRLSVDPDINMSGIPVAVALQMKPYERSEYRRSGFLPGRIQKLLEPDEASNK